MAADTFLLELGVEELPPGAIDTLSDALADGIRQGLDDADIEHGDIRPMPVRGAWPFRSPRWPTSNRIAKSNAAAPPWLPPSRTASRPRPPRLRPLLWRQRRVADPSRNGQGNLAGLSRTAAGRGNHDPAACHRREIHRLPTGAQEHALGRSRVEFSRPAHWLVMLFGEHVVDASALGLQAGRTTRGHRFHAPDPIELGHADDYLSAMENAWVLADREQRRERIREQVLAEAEVQAATAVIDEELLTEVSGLVEWPVALTGSFDERFLEVPAECLISSMKANQKYFHLLDDDGQLRPQFITIANIDSQRPTWSFRQRKSHSAAPGRRGLLLRYRPAASAGRAHGGASQRRLPAAARHPGRQGPPQRGRGGLHRRSHRWRRGLCPARQRTGQV